MRCVRGFREGRTTCAELAKVCALSARSSEWCTEYAEGVGIMRCMLFCILEAVDPSLPKILLQFSYTTGSKIKAVPDNYLG